MGKKAWWSQGVQFECQGSGKCCVSRGEYGYVYLSLKDRKRLAQHLGIPTRKFTQTYCSSNDGWIFLKNPQLPCGFLKANQCTVYEGRPTQCRTWPFWPENMSVRNWAKEVASYCPGVGKGRVYSAEEIEKILKIE
jgi:Fe-S-cluster containining protein